MIRFLCTSSIVILFLVLSIPLMAVEWCIGKFNRHARDISCLRIVQAVFRLCLRTAGVRTTLIGAEHIPKDRPALYVLNHRSFFDILLVYIQMPGPTGFVAKKELRKAPLLNVWMHFLYCLFLDRQNMKEGLKTILKAIEQVKNGISVCICPEGTRNHEDELLPFKDGSFKIALKSGCPIVPIALNNTSAIFEDQFPRIKKAHVIMEVCEPIEVDTLSAEERKNIAQYTRELIRQTLDRNAPLLAEVQSKTR